jgi:hypothetical protein
MPINVLYVLVSGHAAQSVLEAVAQALRVFREYEWCDLALAATIDRACTVVEV